MKAKLIFTIFLMSMVFTNAYSQQDVNGWYWLNGRPTGNTLNWVKIINSSTIYAVGTRGTFIKSIDGGSTWSVNSQVGNPDNSSTGGLATRDLNSAWFMDANTGIAGGATSVAASGVAAGTLSRTTDGGNTWTYVQYNDTAGTIRNFYFIDGNTGFVCGGTRVRVTKTNDGGLTWTDAFGDLPPTNTYESVFAFDENNIIVTTSSNRIFRTANGGVNWVQTTLPGSSATITDVYFKDANTGYVCGNSNYFAYTLNGGNSWNQSNPPASVGQRRLKYSNGSIYLVGAYTEIYKSTDDGASWGSMNFVDGTNPNQPAQFVMYGIDVVGSQIAVSGNAGIINVSTDGGNTWNNKNYSITNTIGGIYGNTNFSSIQVLGGAESIDGVSQDEIWLGPSGGGYLLYSSNGGADWDKRATSHTRSVLDVEFIDENTGYICGGFPNNPTGIGEISKTIDGGISWTYLTLPSIMNTSQINAVSFVDANTGYAAGFRHAFEPGLVWKTTDGGLNWTSQSFDSPPGGSIVNVHMINVDTGYALANSLYTTTNGGSNWVKTTNAYVLATGWSNMFVYDKDIIYLNGLGTGGLKKVIRSLDGGQTWTDLTGNLLSTFTAFKTYWLNLKHGIVSGTGGYCAKTTDGGLNWTASNPGGFTTVGLSLPHKNTWYTIAANTPYYQAWRKYDNLTSISLNVTMLIEGFWDGKPMVTDTVTVQLRSSVSPYALVEETREVVNINGFQTYEFNSAPAGSYYVVLRHRNGLETWSAAPIDVEAGGNYDYDFTTSASLAYGNNMILKAGKYCIYSGDANQDGQVDASDISLTDNDAFNFATGYLPTDADGNNVIDNIDLSITDNNAFNFIGKQTPP